MSRPEGPPPNDTARIASAFAAQLKAARKRLTADMEAQGLCAAQGWRIHEEMLNTPTGLALRLMPVHRTEVAPAGLEAVVSLS